MKYANVIYTTVFCFCLLSKGQAQVYPPAVGQPGTTAMRADSAAFVNWAVACQVVRGYQNISVPSGPFASAGDQTMGTGKALDNGPVSLGDGGYAVCTFADPIRNGAGPDFAVFENGFDDSFLELAFVEVSSDGVHYFRFPSHSLTDTVNQTGSFGSSDPTKLNNLAGKYRGGYGVPFNLQDLPSDPLLNINAITHVKIIDVIGSINGTYATRDSYHNKVNDPWPTDFASGGFDLDAIGVIHEQKVTGVPESRSKTLVVFPNPAMAGDRLWVDSPCPLIGAELIDLFGASVRSFDKGLSTHDLAPGVYSLVVMTTCGVSSHKIIIR